MSGLDLVITSYGSLLRLPVLGETSWRFVVLDEAQAIKNPNAKQTRAAKALQAEAGSPDRNAGGKPPRRPVVDLRLHQSRPARKREGVRPLPPRPWPSGRTTRTARCAIWSGPTSCGG